MRQLVSLVLNDDGHGTLQAIHGAQALEIIGEDRPDLVLSDVMMPVLSGAELCRRLKANADTQSIRSS